MISSTPMLLIPSLLKINRDHRKSAKSASEMEMRWRGGGGADAECWQNIPNVAGSLAMKGVPVVLEVGGHNTRGGSMILRHSSYAVKEKLFMYLGITEMGT